MGAWGAGIFDSDETLDLMTEMLQRSDPRNDIRQGFAVVNRAEYVEVTDGEAALVFAAIVKAVLFKEPLEPSQDAEWTAWLQRIAGLEMTDLVAPAIRACRRVLADGSELAELWTDNEEMYPVWKGNVEAIIRGLER